MFSSLDQSAKWREDILLAILLCFTCLIYWTGLSGDFFLDDYPHIIHNKSIKLTELSWEALWAAANSTNSGPLGRPLALASFAVNYRYTQLDPFFFKLTNLALHLFTGIGIFLLVKNLASRFKSHFTSANLALLVTALWLLHPLNVSTVLYAVQRMTILSTMLIVWAMVAYCHGRQGILVNRKSGWGWIALGLFIGALGLFAKETAVLILGYLLVIEWLIFDFEMPSAHQRLALQSVYFLGIALPLTWALSNSLLAPGWATNAYANRSFTLSERLLTELRVLWDYISLTILPNIQKMGLFHDGYRISQNLFTPLTTLLALIAHVALILFAWMFRKRWPILAFAVAWLYIGHSAEATLLPLEIKYEHRNYLPMLGMLLLMAHLLSSATARPLHNSWMRGSAIIVVLMTLSASTWVRATQFGDFWGFAGMEAHHHPESSRANQGAAMSLIRLMTETKQSSPQLVNQATEYLQRSASTNVNTTAPLFTGVLFLPEITQRPPSPQFMNELNRRLSHARVDANINSFFLALLRQAEAEKLMMTHGQVHALFEAAESNPHIKNAMKSEIMGIRATYTQSIENDNAKARAYIDQALAYAPEMSHTYVPAVWIYQEAGLWQDAGVLLNTLKKLDTYGINREGIAWLSQRQLQKKD